MYYFAYGSNMARARILERMSSAELVTRAYLLRHCLSFHKIGQDGSAKCDAFETGNDRDLKPFHWYKGHVLIGALPRRVYR